MKPGAYEIGCGVVVMFVGILNAALHLSWIAPAAFIVGPCLIGYGIWKMSPASVLRERERAVSLRERERDLERREAALKQEEEEP